MNVLVFEDPQAVGDGTGFAERIDPVARAHPVMTSMMVTWLDETLRGVQKQPTRWFLIEHDGDAVAAAMHTVGNNVIMSPLPDAGRREAVEQLADALLAVGETLPGATGRACDVQAFAQAWEQRGGGPGRVVLDDWLYEITHVPAGPTVEGFGRPPAEADAPLLLRYLSEFNIEAHPGVDQRSADAKAELRVARSGLHVWEAGGEVVCVAGLSGPARGMARVGPVHTPPRFRRRGFAAALTAYAVGLAFERGAQSCMLYADQANATSNGVYLRLGFKVVDSNVMLSFDSAAPA